LTDGGIPDRFESSGELVYLVSSAGEARLARAASGRLLRCVRRWTGEPGAALAEASTARGASLSRGAMGDLAAMGSREGFLVSIRGDDRERFEETMDDVPARYVGETGGPPGVREILN
jgi:hypothetical protein